MYDYDKLLSCLWSLWSKAADARHGWSLSSVLVKQWQEVAALG